MKLSKDILLDNGWEEYIDPVFKDLPEYYHHESYRIVSTNSNNETVYITIQRGLSNYLNRDWYVHVDNSYHESIGSVDVDTTEHVNAFMNVLSIQYRFPVLYHFPVFEN